MKRPDNAGAVRQRVLDARQLALKMIANVTYGYTAASFSGRMPCVDIADAIVETVRACATRGSPQPDARAVAPQGRRTLERAIHMVEGDPKWRAQVVYGDTDSLFVLLPGRSKEEAFRIGEVRPWLGLVSAPAQHLLRRCSAGNRGACDRVQSSARQAEDGEGVHALRAGQ